MFVLFNIDKTQYIVLQYKRISWSGKMEQCLYSLFYFSAPFFILKVELRDDLLSLGGTFAPQLPQNKPKEIYMGLIKATSKFILRKLSDRKTKSDTKNARDSSYNSTAYKINKAKITKKYINGKAVYEKEFNKKMKKVLRDDELRNKFIDEM